MKTRFSMASRLGWAWFLVLSLMVCPQVGRAAPPLTTLYSFRDSGAANGFNPYAGLLLGKDGNLYGTTVSGGTDYHGNIFKITPFSGLTSLYNFSGTDGANPYAALIQGNDGNLYGTTYNGGANGVGTVFQVTTSGNLKTLHSFTGNDGANPYAGLIQGTDGNLYGTTSQGASGAGTVFQITTSGKLTILHSFAGTDGANPYAGLLQGNDGNFYGTTYDGGADGVGTVFQITPAGKLTTLHSFTGANGANPYASLIQATDGNFYGTTSSGGADYAGTVFQITPAGKLKTLHSFTGADGASSYACLIQGTDGDLYGTTYYGGAYGAGTVFQITPSGKLTTLHSFNSSDGSSPVASLTAGAGGILYGTASQGGAFGGYFGGYGTVFTITTSGSLTTLASFNGPNDAFPGDLTPGKDGNFYSVTYGGGDFNVGTVFKVTTTGVLTTLYNFTGGADGAHPYAGLIQGKDGDLYGITSQGGDYGAGTVFTITPSGALTTLYSFTGGNDGANPFTGLIQGTDGDLYGTTYYGGASGVGTVFQITPSGVLTTLYSFTGGNDGSNPLAGLIQGTDGNLYGTTSGGAYGAGTLFRITLSGVLTTLYSFTGGNDGVYPVSLILGKDGYLYGTTSQGGIHTYYGTVFKVTTSGALTTLHSFNGHHDGAYPDNRLFQDKYGNLYSTTYAGGADGDGTLFKITPSGALTTLSIFTGGNEPSRPFAGLTLGKDGNLYSTSEFGGSNQDGTVYQLMMKPIVRSFSPASGPVGTSVSIKGANFSEAINVQFGNIYVAFKVNSDTSLTLTVPEGARSAGITVFNAFGKGVTRSQFLVTP